MNKKVLIVAIGMCVMLLAGGCGKKDVEKGTPRNETDQAVTLTKGDYKLSKYIKLGDYKNIPVTVEPIAVTEEDIDKAIQQDLAANAKDVEITDRPAQEGDTVNIDYEGLKDGVAFDGGTDKAYDLILGSGKFIPGFEDQLVGTNKGDKVEVKVTFPEDYQQADLAGQPVVFNVTVNEIKQSVVPELSEDFVKNTMNMDNVDAYKTSVRTKLEEQNKTTMRDNKTNSVMTAIEENSKIEVPQVLTDYYYNSFKNDYIQYATTYGMDLNGLIQAFGMTKEDFDKKADEYGQSKAKQELVIKAIIKAEKMDLTDEEYQTGVDKILSDYGYESEEKLYESVSKEIVRENLLWQKAIDFVTDQAVES